MPERITEIKLYHYLAREWLDVPIAQCNNPVAAKEDRPENCLTAGIRVFRSFPGRKRGRRSPSAANTAAHRPTPVALKYSPLAAVGRGAMLQNFNRIHATGRIIGEPQLYDDPHAGCKVLRFELTLEKVFKTDVPVAIVKAFGATAIDMAQAIRADDEVVVIGSLRREKRAIKGRLRTQIIICVLQYTVFPHGQETTQLDGGEGSNAGDDRQDHGPARDYPDGDVPPDGGELSDDLAVAQGQDEDPNGSPAANAGDVAGGELADGMTGG